jgi:hypothetical protein
MSRFTRKPVVVSAIIVCALASTGIAIAFWTASGSGSVSATAGSGGTITLSGSVVSGIAPGLSKTVSLAASNPTTSAVTVGTVSLTGVTVDGGHAACDTDDFSMADVAQDQSIAAGASNIALTDTGTFVYANTGVNQDACKGATLTLALEST